MPAVTHHQTTPPQPDGPSLARRVLATAGILGLVVALAVAFARRRELS
ncbi:MAG: hypothetical protein R2754_00780 [Microthrixaceae bacterium]